MTKQQKEQVYSEAFEILIFDYFKNSKRYNKTRFMMLRAREIMLRENPESFSKLQLDYQFKICLTIITVSMASTNTVTEIFRVFSKKETSQTTKDFSLEYGFEEHETIYINSNSLPLKITQI